MGAHAQKTQWGVRPGLLVGCIVMILSGCADRVILYPSSRPIDPMGASRQTISFQGGVLEVWAARSPGAMAREPEAFVLEFCGNASRAELVAAYGAWQWGRRPIELWAVNYPGYGGSTGPARLRSIAPAVLAAYDQLKRSANGRPIFVAGHSLGTTAALCVSANRPVKGLLLQSPPPLRQLILGKFGWWNLWLLAGPVAMGVPAELDSIANARATAAPAVFILTEKDRVVPVPFQRQVADAYGGKTRIIRLADAGHNDPIGDGQKAEFGAALDWLWSGRISQVNSGD